MEKQGKCLTSNHIAQAILQSKCGYCPGAWKSESGSKEVVSYCNGARLLIEKIGAWFEICHTPIFCLSSGKWVGGSLCLRRKALDWCKEDCHPIFAVALKLVIRKGDAFFQYQSVPHVSSFPTGPGIILLSPALKRPKVIKETKAQMMRREKADKGMRKIFRERKEQIRKKANLPLPPPRPVWANGYLKDPSKGKHLQCEECHENVNILHFNKNSRQLVCLRCLKEIRKQRLVAKQTKRLHPLTEKERYFREVFGGNNTSHCEELAKIGLKDVLSVADADPETLRLLLGGQAFTQIREKLVMAGVTHGRIFL